MHLGAQYYRPPFPRPHRWHDDLAAMRDAGLDTVQLWVLWGWVESKPGSFDFADYEEIVAGADRVGLKVVLSTIAEIQPLWIHREIPDCGLMDSFGHRVVSCSRNECHVGLTPGGCTDHPQVWERMARFLERTVRTFANATNLIGWDCWNELRWNVGADDLVCFCPHTVAAYRSWLDHRHGSLEGLNRDWLRRYGAWDEVQPPRQTQGGLPFTDPMAWMHFLTERANRHALARYQIMKAADPRRPVTLHGGDPSPGYAGGRTLYCLDRGNDWHFADRLDGVGCSSFPRWFALDDADFGTRIEFVKSAARGKQVWLSELQGGRSAGGMSIHPAVEAEAQQRWLWNGIACGADTILFWCWRDEVFCSEAGGFGIIGADGHAEARLAALRATGKALATHRPLLESYRPTQGRVGLLFSPQSYYHAWSSEHSAGIARDALSGYARALVRRSIPYTVVEEEHIDALAGLTMLILPRVSVTSPELETALEDFVRGGGTLVCESETGAFTPEGFYRYGDERMLYRLTGLREVGRRPLAGEQVTMDLAGTTARVEAAQWLTPLVGQTDATILARHEHGALAAEVAVGAGKVVLLGGYFGDPYYRRKHGDLEVLVEALARRAEALGAIEILEPRPGPTAFLYVKSGEAQGRRLIFVFFGPGQTRARLRFAPGFLRRDRLENLLTGESYALIMSAGGGCELILDAPAIGFAPLAEP